MMTPAEYPRPAILECFFCGDPRGPVLIIPEAGRHCVECQGCGARGPWEADLGDAVTTWNEIARGHRDPAPEPAPEAEAEG